MAYTGNINNPVPTNVNKNKENPYFKNTINRSLDIRRDKDSNKNFSISFLDIDTAILEHIQNTLQLSVTDSGNSVKVPVFFGSPERWKAIQLDGYFRDQQGKLQLPAMIVKRNSFSKNENLMTFNRYLTYPVMTKFTEQNKYDRFSILNNTISPVHQIRAVTLPDHVKIEYEFVIWTEYVEQMNEIIQIVNFASDDYWGDPQRFKFRVIINDWSNIVEVSADKDRLVKTTCNVSVYAYLLPTSFENRKSTVQTLLTPRQIKIGSETVVTEQNINEFKKVPSEPYYKINNQMSHNDDSWEIPT